MTPTSASNLSASVLGQLLVMQSVMESLPDEAAIRDFVCRGLSAIPGICAVEWNPGVAAIADESTASFPLMVGAARKGEIVFRLTDPALFLPYAPYLQNFCFMVAVILEEREQRRLLELHQAELEKRVAERTAELVQQMEEREREQASVHQTEERFRLSLLDALEDQTQAKAQLRKSELHLAEAQRIAHLGSWQWVAATDTLTWSKELYTILGVDPSQPLPNMMAPENLYTPDSAARMRAAIARTLQTGEPYEIEVEQAGHAGLHKWLLARGEQWFDEHGQRVGLRGTALDITERKLAEEALKKSEEEYRQLFQNNPNPMWAYDPDTLAFLAINDAAVYHYGYTREEFLAMTIKDIRPPEDLPALDAEIASLPLGIGSPKIWRHRKKDGTLIDVEITGHWTNFAGKRARIILANDVTERRRAEKQIQRQLNQLNALRAIDAAISTSFDLRLTLDVVLDKVMSELGVDATAVLLLNPHLHVLEYFSTKGFYGNINHHTQLRIGEGNAGRVVMERRLLHIDNLAEQPSVGFPNPLPAGERFVSYYAVPLIAKGQVKGVLEIYHRKPFDGDAEWLDLLTTLAGQAAIAIDNGQLFNDLQRSNFELELAYDATIEGWSHALDLRDKETEGHTLRVVDLTMEIARMMGMGEADLVHIRRGALLHDIGKMGVPDAILLKPDTLTAEEWDIMRRHPQYAYEMLLPIIYLRPAIDIPYCHHEKWDGTGYPRGLHGEQIPLAARIFAVVDVWDAMTSNRTYRAALPREQVKEHIRHQAGKQFDPRVVDVFLRLVNAKANE